LIYLDDFWSIVAKKINSLYDGDIEVSLMNRGQDAMMSDPGVDGFVLITCPGQATLASKQHLLESFHQLLQIPSCSFFFLVSLSTLSSLKLLFLLPKRLQPFVQPCPSPQSSASTAPASTPKSSTSKPAPSNVSSQRLSTSSSSPLPSSAQPATACSRFSTAASPSSAGKPSPTITCSRTRKSNPRYEL